MILNKGKRALEQYNIDINATEIQVVGELNIQAIKELIGVELPVGTVQIYAGALKHIKRRHPGVLEQYGHLIPGMIAFPDYIGKNPTEPNSVELVKIVEDHLLLAIKLDPTGYVFVSSFYDLANGEAKLQKRLDSGRWVPYPPEF
ncbi:hypothetical protein QYF50_26090 [Paenibacillus vini]|uniref:PBECR3 domain-containing polyvalent protein n=1 Tax=Paenibacillus vini TaxID=1476024 RepID=UPI0025B6BD46|nr:hypothetical protein [Paenibacillus vini]MDN4071367.1 hypothetical protein [Paenibacillus vini]